MTERYFTVSCVDPVFGTRCNNGGGYPSIDAAVAAAERMKRQQYTRCSQWRIHITPADRPFLSVVTAESTVLSLLF